PLSQLALTRDPRRRQLGLRYLFGAGLCALPAFALGGGWLWLLWPVVSLTLVGLTYLLFGARGFQKGSDGQLGMAGRWLLAPYLAAAWLNSRLWTWRQPAPVEVRDGVWLGRIPGRRALVLSPFTGLVDLCAELS